MLCSSPSVCECGTVGHDVLEAISVSVSVCADYVDEVMDSFLLSCQRSVMSATKPAEVYSVRVLSGVFRGEDGELECWGMVLNLVYSACMVVLMLRGIGWCASM